MITKTEAIDIAWRAGWTFLGTLLTLWPSTQLASALSGGDAQFVVHSVWKVLAPVLIASLAAAFTVVKAFISNKIGTGTAATRVTTNLQTPVASAYTKVLPPPPTGEQVP